MKRGKTDKKVQGNVIMFIRVSVCMHVLTSEAGLMGWGGGGGGGLQVAICYWELLPGKYILRKVHSPTPRMFSPI